MDCVNFTEVVDRVRDFRERCGVLVDEADDMCRLRLGNEGGVFENIDCLTLLSNAVVLYVFRTVY